MNLWIPAGGIWTPEKSRQLPHQVTTANIGACYPFMAQGSLGTRGVYIGQDLYGAGGFCYDPWELYPHLITSPNMLVIGQLGKGKSANVKTYVDRQLVFGRRAFVMDPKDAAYATREMLKPKHAIPFHYGTFPVLKGTPQEYQAALGQTTTQVFPISPGDKLSF